MTGRRVFFSFHYKQDVMRASIIRNAGKFDAVAAAGWKDASLWEEAKRQGSEAIRHLIDEGLRNTSVTAVLIGQHTASRDWVDFEISESIQRGNGILGVRIHNVRDPNQGKSRRGPVPKALAKQKCRIYEWNASSFGRWVELAAIESGKPCLKHDARNCQKCKFSLRFW